MTTIKDLVLIHVEDTPVSFARVESILPDVKKDWYQIKLLMLQIPLQVVTWILKDDYINGTEFHMNGKRMKLVMVESPVEELSFDNPANESGTDAGRLEKKSGDTDNVIRFSDFKKDK